MNTKTEPISMDVPGYEGLSAILHRAYDQAARGKGKERHADAKPFDKQPMQTIAQRRGLGFILGQADKKSEEAQGMLERGEADKCVHELLGAIVYLAGAILHIEGRPKPITDEDEWKPNAFWRMPVGGHVLVRVQQRDGGTFTATAERLRWGCRQSPSDILRWRIAPANDNATDVMAPVHG